MAIHIDNHAAYLDENFKELQQIRKNTEELDFSNSFGLDYAKEYGKNLVGYQPTMISRMNYKPGENPWYEYVKSLIQTNKDFANAVREKIKLPDSEPTVSNLTNDFIKYSKHLYHNDSDRPNLESHKAKVAEWETMKQEPLPDLSASTLESIESDVKNVSAYKDEMRKINDKYVKLFDKGRLTDPEMYNRLPPLEPGMKEKLIEKGQQIIAAQQKKSAELSRIFSDCLDSANQVKPGCTRKEMLDMMLLTLGDASNPTEAKKKIMNSSKEIKRNFFFSWFGLHRNPASTRLRTLLGGLAAKPDKAEISPNELMDLHNAAKDLKFSLDHGNTLTPEEVKKLSGIDQRRYALANKVQTAVEQQLYKDGENVLFTKEAEKQPTLSDLNLSDSALKM